MKHRWTELKYTLGKWVVKVVNGYNWITILSGNGNFVLDKWNIGFRYNRFIYFFSENQC